MTPRHALHESTSRRGHHAATRFADIDQVRGAVVAEDRAERKTRNVPRGTRDYCVWYGAFWMMEPCDRSVLNGKA